MFCCKCQKDLSECTCGDIDERLASLNNSKYVVYRKCLICGKHYARCKCENPEWGMSGENEEVPIIKEQITNESRK